MKIAIVNEQAPIAETLRLIVSNTEEHAVVWVAQSGEQALQFCTANRPDLILMSLALPGMDGVETTRRIMRESPCAILIVTAAPDENTNQVFRCLGVGALDVVATQVISGAADLDARLLAKIRTVGKLVNAEIRVGAPLSKTVETEVDLLVAIGASTGGPVALAAVLAGWTLAPGSTVVIVQHIDAAFTDNFCDWLARQVQSPVEVIEEGARPMPGKIMLAKTNDHLRLDSLGRLRYGVHPVDYPYRPSVNVFFESVARHWHKAAIGILLTGMGRDGAEGLRAMRLAGKTTLAQDRASSTVYGMPHAAAEIDAAEQVLPLEPMRELLKKRSGMLELEK